MVHETTERDPERIYLYTWPPEPEGESERATGVEYIRADLHDAEIARLTRELEEARELLRQIAADRCRCLHPFDICGNCRARRALVADDDEAL